jgi:hypothetical protein
VSDEDDCIESGDDFKTIVIEITVVTGIYVSDDDDDDNNYVP